MGAIQRFFNPTCTAETYRSILLMEMLWGLKPFISTRKNPMVVRTSIVGVSLTIFHVFAFIACTTMVLWIGSTMTTTITITDTPLAMVQTKAMTALRSVNTVIIFVQIACHRNRDILYVQLIIPMDSHFQAVGCDMPHLYRRTLLGFLKAAVGMVLNISGLFMHGMYFYSITIPDDCWLAAVVGVATVLPMCYIQVVLLHFGICILFVRRRILILNHILMSVLTREEEQQPKRFRFIV